MSADNQQERPKNINPWYITGFVEGEGTFHIAIYRDPKMKYGIKIIPEFHINQSYLRQETLQQIKTYFKCGYIKHNHKTNDRDDTLVYVVRNRNDLMQKIIPFFEKYPMLSKKQESFLIFKQIVWWLDQGKHTTKTGVKKIIKLSYQMNNSGKNRKIRKEDLLDFLESSETIRQKCA
ncbi:MAG: hypothetical protein A3B89_01890 [Candidatus Buchananbacteria bacterium RIFCSPHIGHO2_02_FULL_40_13]|uniref:Homing endonuclease LAGLIDADG domain-containing protein n=1 Tax=Candidatus Buchananbacteria bacterium RIFCSPLOWO2_01_FULL_39_33 TaxID=1797543 RepID=A0A1G1YL63_9BACT|nr:MAG: hypothetical protein A2820_03685 [Candidatus Buchananbacteria bacterium RIFCSPHIGHO2_01_FULL_40_35]OGY50530.1 MAG: hypothetical protein A3B89_01890 [Candidatus Buchananbacteria bacterium RIFCSPHIGHO2_02_FULL_40_13]OGY52576.1 MAG: hypothetical protein A3A02_00925 [Candidatus Buchananbacteria bacterium RIFCSPLOWO2_01_FULL_39_33]